MAVRREFEGPARFFATHPVAYRISLVGAAVAGIIFFNRAVTVRGFKRFAWAALAIFQLMQMRGIKSLHASAKSSPPT